MGQTKEELIAKHLANQIPELSRLNESEINHLEAALEHATSLEHAQAIVKASLSQVKSIHSDHVKTHKLSFIITATRKLLTGAAEILDANGNRTNLPTPVFCLSGMDGGANYKQLLAEYVPSNCLITSVLPTVDGISLVVSYQDKTTGNVETVTISQPGNDSYLKLLYGTRTASMTLTEPKMRIDNETQAAFFDQPVYTLNNSMFSSKSQDKFFPNVFEPDVTPNPIMRRIGHELAVDNEKGFAFLMTPNYKQGQVTQSNGQFWVTTLIGLSNNWEKVGEHRGLH